jgi:hypothetical protein
LYQSMIGRIRTCSRFKPKKSGRLSQHPDPRQHMGDDFRLGRPYLAAC